MSDMVNWRDRWKTITAWVLIVVVWVSILTIFSWLIILVVGLALFGI